MPHAPMSRIFGGPITVSLYETESNLYFADQSPLATITPSMSDTGRQDHHEPALAIVRAVNCHDRLVKALEGCIGEAGQRGGEGDAMLHPGRQSAAVQEAMAAHEEAAGWHVVTWADPQMPEQMEPHAEPARHPAPMASGGYLCIGGPYSGRRIETMKGHPTFVATETLDVDGSEGIPVEIVQRVKRTRYVLDEIHGSAKAPRNDGFIHRFWRPEDQPLSKTLHILLEAYAKGARP